MPKSTSLRATAKQSRAHQWIAASLTLLAMTIWAPSSAFAQDGHRYAPAPCEFGVTFPEPFETQERCAPGNEARCYEQASFTKVFDLQATIQFRVICNPVAPDVITQYDGDVMKATLRAMTRDAVIDTYDVSFQEEERFKQASLAGSGQAGITPTIYIAQLWIGQRSALSIEAELIGDTHDTADRVFGDILKGVGYLQELEKSK